MRLRLSWTVLLREGRAGRARRAFLVFCLALGVGAVVAVRGLVDGVREGMANESRAILSADLVLESRRPLAPETRGFFADRPGVETTDVIDLTTMARAVPGDGDPGAADEPPASRLVELRVVEGRYPLVGAMTCDPPGRLEDLLAEDAVVIGEELARRFEVRAGGEVAIGRERFRVAAVLLEEPGRIDFSFAAGPRVYVSRAGFERTRLGGFGSRARYKSLHLLPDGQDPLALARLEEAFASSEHEAPWIRLRTHRNAQPTVQQAVNRVGGFLGLVALLSLLLGGMGVAQITRAWVASRTRHVAILRCLGWRPREIMVAFLWQIALLALLGSLIGVVLGGSVTALVPRVAPELLPPEALDWVQPGSWALGLGAGVGIALLFCLLPLTAIWRVPPSRVLREEARPLRTPWLMVAGAVVVLMTGVFGAAWLQTQRIDQSLGFSIGLAVLVVLLGASAALLSRVSGWLPRDRVGPYLRHGLSAFARPGAGTVGATVALGLGVLVVFGMWVIETRLRSGLTSILPEDAPSCFLLDIQPDQWEGVQGALGDVGATRVDMAPLVTGRLRALEGKTVSQLVEEREDGRRGRWVLTREQRLSTSPELPEDNRIVASLSGEATVSSPWSLPGVAEVSIEEKYAQDMGAELGDRITIDILGLPIELRITSIRRVEWRSFGINFFLIVEPGVIDELPGYRIAVARIGEEVEGGFQDRLAAKYPNVTVVRVREAVDLVLGLLGRVALAVRGLGTFTIFVGLVILAGAVAATSLRRGKEVALLKALGIRRGGIVGLFGVEYGLLGLVAGLVGGAGALVLAEAFFVHVADLDVAIPWSSLPVVGLGSAVLAVSCGLLASRRAMQAPPIDNLRGGV